MSDVAVTKLGDVVEAISAGVSLPGEERLPQADEVGILTLSAVAGARLAPEACKAVSSDRRSTLGRSVRAGTVLMSRSNTPELVGSCIYVEKDYPNLYLPDLIWEIRVRPDAPCDGRWLVSYFRSVPGRRALMRAAAGTSRSMVKLSMARLRRIQIPLPPAGIRQAAVEAIGLLDRVVDCLDSLLKAKRTLRNGFMQDLLSGRRHIPKYGHAEWRAYTLGELLRPVPRKTCKPSSPFLSAGVRSHGRGVFLKTEFHPDAIALDELFQLKHRDLVVNITFGWEGALAIVPLEADGALVSHRFPTYEVDENKVLVDYLLHLIRSKRFVFDVGKASPGGAGRNRVLNRTEFLKITLKLPSINQQRRISETMNTFDTEIGLLERERDCREAFSRGLLSRLLSGELALSSRA